MAERPGPIAVVAEYPSKSQPGVVYEVRIGNDGVTYCTCRGWVNAKNKLRKLGLEGTKDADCKHTLLYKGE